MGHDDFPHWGASNGHVLVHGLDTAVGFSVDILDSCNQGPCSYLQSGPPDMTILVSNVYAPIWHVYLIDLCYLAPRTSDIWAGTVVRAMSGSMALGQPGAVLMSQGPASIKDSADAWSLGYHLWPCCC